MWFCLVCLCNVFEFMISFHRISHQISNWTLNVSLIDFKNFLFYFWKQSFFCFLYKQRINHHIIIIITTAIIDGFFLFRFVLFFSLSLFFFRCFSKYHIAYSWINIYIIQKKKFRIQIFNEEFFRSSYGRWIEWLREKNDG